MQQSEDPQMVEHQEMEYDVPSFDIMEGEEAGEYEEIYEFEEDEFEEEEFEVIETTERKVIGNLSYAIERKNDGYWQRGTFYRSKVRGERLFHVRVSAGADVLKRFYFIGAVEPKTSEDRELYARIYELNQDQSLFVIDSFPILAFEGEWVSSDDGLYFNEFILRHYDNLLLQGDKLYYFKEQAYPENFNSIAEYKNNRSYYAYKLGSGEKPQPVNSSNVPISNNRSMINTYEQVTFSPDSKRIAYNYTYNIYIMHLNVDQAGLDSLQAKAKGLYEYFDEKRGDLSLAEFFPSDPSEPCTSRPLLGAMNWHPSGNVLFFDNSGECYACIWTVDIAKRKVTKIVPEHEAIHPYYFNYFGQELLAYVEENCIKFCEAPASNRSFQ